MIGEFIGVEVLVKSWSMIIDILNVDVEFDEEDVMLLLEEEMTEERAVVFIGTNMFTIDLLRENVQGILVMEIEMWTWSKEFDIIGFGCVEKGYM